MLRPIAVLAVLMGTLVAASKPVAAQLLSAGVGPAFPTGNFKDLSDPGTGVLLSGRLNLGILPLVQLQIELSTVRGWDTASIEGDETIRVTSGGANLALHFVRLASIRPYVLAGLIGSVQSLEGGLGESEDDFHFGYQTGAGLDFRLGPLTPFVELRWVSLDGPDDQRYTYVPLLIGIKIL